MAASRKRRKPQRVPRKRRTPDEARRLILDTAEARLREGGPSALHLKEIACDAGISHPTILHHFESREGLVQALLSRGMDRLESALLAVVQTAPPTQETVQAATERIFALMGDAGHARLLALRALEVGGPGPGADEPVLRRLTDVVHARRAAFHVRGQPPISRADLRTVHRALDRRRPRAGARELPRALRTSALRASGCGRRGGCSAPAAQNPAQEAPRLTRLEGDARADPSRWRGRVAESVEADP
jgi:AcrR family transcriptional regulator